MWSKLQHPNILSLLGYTFCDDTGFPLLISEWMEYGTARTYVKSHPSLSLREVVELVRTPDFCMCFVLIR